MPISRTCTSSICAAGAVEARLKETAKLQYSATSVVQLAQSTKALAGQVRFGLRLLNAFGRAAAVKQVMQQRPAT